MCECSFKSSKSLNDTKEYHLLYIGQGNCYCKASTNHTHPINHILCAICSNLTRGLVGRESGLPSHFPWNLEYKIQVIISGNKRDGCFRLRLVCLSVLQATLAGNQHLSFLFLILLQLLKNLIGTWNSEFTSHHGWLTKKSVLWRKLLESLTFGGFRA